MIHAVSGLDFADVTLAIFLALEGCDLCQTQAVSHAVV